MADTSDKPIETIDPSTGQVVVVGTIGEAVNSVRTLIQTNRSEENIALKLSTIHAILFDIVSVVKGVDDKLDSKVETIISEIQLTRDFFGEATSRLDKRISALEGKMQNGFKELQDDNQRNVEMLSKQLKLLLEK